MNPEYAKVLLRTAPFLLLIFAVWMAVRKRRLSRDLLVLQKPVTWTHFYLWWLGFLAFIVLAEITLNYLGLYRHSVWSGTFGPSVIKIIGIVILAPVAEELFFRGIVIGKLQQWKVNEHLAVVLQAILFTVSHTAMFNYDIDANIAKAQLFTDSILFAYARFHTKSLYTPIAMHATGNLVAVVEQFL